MFATRAFMRNQPVTLADGYYYLAGPMTGIPQFNFPAFDRIAAELRQAGYVIVSPSELDDPEVRKAAYASVDGQAETSDAKWRGYLRRDLEIVMSEFCIGVIAIPGWTGSKGALLETYVNEQFGRPLYLYTSDGRGFELQEIDRASLKDGLRVV